jgi:serine/threonine protein kinase
MAPEVAAGERDVDARADVYSLGVVAYRCVVGQLPFTGDAYRVLEAQINDAPPLPSDIDPTLGHEVDEVLLRALAKVPSDRYPTAGTFAAALSAAAQPTTGVGAPAAHEALATIVQSISSQMANGRMQDLDPEQSVTVDDVASMVSISALPRLPKADVAIFRPRGRHRAKVIALLVAVATGGAIGLVVGLAHR